MKHTQTVRIGIIGCGGIANGKHMPALSKLANVEMVAFCDINPQRAEQAKISYGTPDAKVYTDYRALLQDTSIDAVHVCTPNRSHSLITVDALQAGKHVLCEKPAGVYTLQVRDMIAEADKHPELTFGMMFNQRTNCTYRKMHELIHSGAIGDLKRVNWIITDWYRTQAYYNSGGWRATWAGEGGGVMLNQCPHQLDLWQWLCGMPCKIKAVCHEGKWHDIEVEDDVTIYAEYPNGATGTFITTTGDYPGTNRLEITLDRAKIVCEHDGEKNVFTIKMCELAENISDNLKNCPEGFADIKCEWKDVETDGKNEQHVGVVNAFAAHLLRGEPLIADGREGINGLTISNAAFLSSWLDKTVEIPFDEELYYEKLQEKIKNSTYKKTVVEQVQSDMSSTF